MITANVYDLVLDLYHMVHVHELLVCRVLLVLQVSNLERHMVIDIGDYEYDNGE